MLAANSTTSTGPRSSAASSSGSSRESGSTGSFAEFQSGGLEDTPIPTQGLPPDHRQSGVPVRPPADLQPPPLRPQHPPEAARRSPGAPGARVCDRPRSHRLGGVARPLRPREGDPAARDARVQPEAQGLPPRPRQGPGASCPGRLPGREGLARRSPSGRASAPTRSSASTSGSARTSRRWVSLRSSSTTPTGRASPRPCQSGSCRSFSERGSPTFRIPRTSSRSCSTPAARGTTMGYANPAVDALLDKARAEPDMARRVEVYRRAEELVMDDAAGDPRLASDVRAAVPAVRQGRRGERPRRRVHSVPEGVARATPR